MHQPVNKNPRRVNLIRIEFARLDNNLRFGHGNSKASNTAT